MTVCPFCGYEYESAATARCPGCPLANVCAMGCCPRCGYKLPTESRLGKLIRRLTTRGAARDNADVAPQR